MENYVNGIAGVFKIQNKVDAMQYAISTTMQWKCGENSKVDYDEAKKLFDFICANVDFPADVNKMLADDLHQMVEALSATQKNKSFIDCLFKSHDVPLAAAVCADADVSAFEDAIFRPRIKEGEWHCNKENPPYKDMPMAVVEVPEKLYYLARYCHESNVWCDLNTGEIIKNVVSYYPVKC